MGTVNTVLTGAEMHNSARPDCVCMKDSGYFWHVKWLRTMLVSEEELVDPRNLG